MALFSRRNISSNPFGLTKYDLKGDIKNFPMGVVVRMMEEQELQGNEPDVTVFQKDFTSDVNENGGGFDWGNSIDGFNFWENAVGACNFDLFFKKYPEYARYNLA